MTKSALKHGLGFRLVVASLLVSTVLSAVAAAIQLYDSYLRQRYEIAAIFDQIEKALTPPLEKALWKFDFEQVDVILDGIVANEAVATLKLTTPSHYTWERGAGSDYDLTQVYELEYIGPNGNAVNVGRLEAFLSLDGVNGFIWAQFWTILTSNLVKAYFSAAVLLWLFSYMVTKPLKEIATYLDDPTPPGAKRDLALTRKTNAVSDDIDKIVEAQNHSRKRIAGMIGQLEDEVVEREEAEAEARKASEIRKVFLANMSHEIRTPLNAIMGLFQLIIMADIPERQKKQAETGLAASVRLLEQLVNVLEISRIEANAVDVTPRPTNIRRAVTQWFETARATCHRLEKDVEVEVRIDDQVPENALFDERRVTQIVNNLTNNALKFTDEGRVLIEVRNGPVNALDISVCDTGRGIPAHMQASIFGRFTQVDSAQTREVSGSGLGLAISRELAELMQASLEVESPSTMGCFATVMLLRLNAP